MGSLFKRYIIFLIDTRVFILMILQALSWFLMHNNTR